MTDTPATLFLVLDSMRLDRVSAYDHDRQTTPMLSWFSDRATTYTNAITPTPWTLPSHTSMFTGQFPSEHGVTNGFSDRMSQLSAETATLAEGLSSEGYQTAGFSNNPWVGQLSGLHRGFDEFVEWDLEISRSTTDGPHSLRDRAYSKGHSALGKAARQPAFLLKRRFFTDNLVQRATRWLGQTASSRAPTFTFLNLMEAHSPYVPPKRAFRQLGLTPPSPIEPRILNTKLLAYVMGKRSLTPAEQRRVMEYYDASLRYQDEKVRELIAFLRETDQFEGMRIVICSDHGKTLGEYDRDEQPPHYLRDSNLNVPLFIKEPGQSTGDVVDEPFELTDLYHVIRHDELATQYTRDVAIAEDFIPHAGSTAPDALTRWRVGVDREYKYIQNDTDEEYLFDRSVDEPVANPDEDILRQCRQTLADRVATFEQSAETGTGGIDSGVQAQLKDLGYM